MNGECQRNILSFLLAAQYKASMSLEEPFPAFAKIWADCVLPPRAPGPPCQRHPCHAGPPITSTPATSIISYADVTDPSYMPSIVARMIAPTASAAPPIPSANCSVKSYTTIKESCSYYSTSQS